MRYATRTFLFSFIPFAMLLMATFCTIQWLVESTVRDRLRSSLRDTHNSIARARTKSELQNSRFLRIVGEDASLKAGLQLLISENGNPGARLTVEDQLRVICESLQFDILLISDARAKPLAGVRRASTGLTAVDVSHLAPPSQGLYTVEDTAYQITSVPIDQADETIGTLSIGERFDFAEFSTPAVLTHNGRVQRSSIPRIPSDQVEAALASCKLTEECELRLGGETYLSLPLQSIYFGEGYLLRSLQSVDSTIGPVQAILRNVFLIAGIAALLAASILSLLSSRSIVKPLGTVVSHLRNAEATGSLPQFDGRPAAITEIRELTDSFNRAAKAIRDASALIQDAYVAFTGSLASALDARDGYTAGHSRRVSALSVDVARTLNLSSSALEEIKIGALLHDIGKIGIGDSVLQKPGRLTPEEFHLIQQHPTIGRHIMEGVPGFQPYLPTVELHHENWDGTGYPRGLHGEETPLPARIVHIVDAFDAMTTDRPYRKGMNREQALRILEENAGSQFDPSIVPVFLAIVRGTDVPHAALDSLQRLSQAIGQSAILVQEEQEKRI